MCFQFRSIILIVGFVIICNNTSNQSLVSSCESNCHGHLKTLERVFESAGPLYMLQECSESSSSIKEPSANEDQGKNTESTTMTSPLLHVEFEIFGKVQGVFFRKNTVEQAEKLRLKGWCMNTPSGTVKGAMEGPASKIKEMKHWLSNVGSKMSRIDKAEFRNEKTVPGFSFENFSVRH